MRTAYIITSTISQLIMLALAIAAPLYITPGFYYWTAFLITIIICDGHAFSERLNGWDKQDERWRNKQ